MSTSPAAVEPVRAALLRAARQDADAVLAGAREQAAAVLDGARGRAEAILAEARRQGAADGAAAGAADLLRARRAARATALAARAEAYRELRRAVAARLEDLRGSPEYPRLRELLAERARRLLGAEVPVGEPPDGGVLAVAGDRRVDLGLTALADRALERAGARVEALWTP